MTVVSVHDLAEVRVGDLVIEVAPPTERTTLEIVVERDASLVLKAPDGASVERVQKFVSTKRSWIYRKLAEKDALVGPPVVKRFVDGEGFAYLGRSYRLLVDESADSIRLSQGRLHAPPSVSEAGAQLMRQWYVKTGSQWLRRRIKPWSARMGIDSVAVEVRDLGYRWGSAKPAEVNQQVNVHWATLQLPPNLVDYVLVHELAHLCEANHTPEFWSIVSQLMPGYEAQKTNLAALGRNIWLGSSDKDGGRN